MSPCFYCGCNRIITRDKSRGDAYLARLYREIALAAQLFDRDREVIQLHFGGGTPNFLPPRSCASWSTGCAAISISPTRRDRDISIELDPRFMRAGRHRELAAHRLQPRQPRRAGLRPRRAGGGQPHPERRRDAARDRCLPRQRLPLGQRRPDLRPAEADRGGFARTLDTVVGARPDRIAVYGYAHLPQLFKAQRQIDAARPAGCRRPSSRCCSWRSRS